MIDGGMLIDKLKQLELGVMTNVGGDEEIDTERFDSLENERNAKSQRNPRSG